MTKALYSYYLFFSMVSASSHTKLNCCSGILTALPSLNTSVKLIFICTFCISFILPPGILPQLALKLDFSPGNNKIGSAFFALAYSLPSGIDTVILEGKTNPIFSPLYCTSNLELLAFVSFLNDFKLTSNLLATKSFVFGGRLN